MGVLRKSVALRPARLSPSNEPDGRHALVLWGSVVLRRPLVIATLERREIVMAQVVMEMTALAVYGGELCSACDRTFERGESMSAVEAEDGAKLGWFCKQCIAEWVAASSNQRFK